MQSDPKKRANRQLLRALLIMTAGSFAFGWALVPLYDVLCRAAGIGNAEAKAGKATVTEAMDPNREVTIEFLVSRVRWAASISGRRWPPCASIRASSTTPCSMP